jgi:hypothetical protein
MTTTIKDCGSERTGFPTVGWHLRPKNRNRVFRRGSAQIFDKFQVVVELGSLVTEIGKVMIVEEPVEFLGVARVDADSDWRSRQK